MSYYKATGGVPPEIIATREKSIWELRQKGYTHQRIADEVGLERSAVTKILQRLSARVVEKLDGLAKEQLTTQIDRLEFIADEMFQAWQKSKEAQKSVSKKTGSGGEQLTIQTEDQDGNIRYLVEARAAMADIRKILGLDAPLRQEHEINIDWSGLNNAQLQRIAQGESPANVLADKSSG